jgi:hypothetical protein
MMSVIGLETSSAFNKFWNNKSHYKVAYCWLFPLIHATMHRSIDIKFMCINIRAESRGGGGYGGE